MEKITITFLGTGSAVPTKLRNHTAILLTYKNDNFLIDCGEGTQRQFRYAEISPNKISHILITHWHGDHILGLPGLFQTLAMNDYQDTLHIYGPKNTAMFLKVLSHLIKMNVKIQAHEARGTVIDEPEFQVQALPMSHGTPALAYAFIIKEKRRLHKDKLKKARLPNSPLLKKLQEGKDIVFHGKKFKASSLTYVEPGKKIAFILDTAPNPNTIKIAKDADLLVCESSFSKKEAEQAKEYKHLTAIDAATIAKKAKVKQLILTHISQRYEHKPKLILDEAKSIFKDTSIVKDLQVVTL